MRCPATLLSMLLILICQSVYAEQVPSREAVSSQIFNYHRIRPMLATSGSLTPTAFAELKTHGFRTVLDLRTEAEGVQEEAKVAELAGLIHYNIPIGSKWPEERAFQRFKQLVENPDNYPMLVHCASANRVGFMWTEYQIRQGVTYDAAVKEGRIIGMKPALEERLALKHGITP